MYGNYLVTHEMAAEPDHPRMVILDLGGGAALNAFEVPDGEIVGERRRQGGRGGRGAIDHHGLAVDSLATLDEVRARLVAAGADIGEIERLGSDWSLFFRDPDGMELEVCCSADRFGRLGWAGAVANREGGAMTISVEQLGPPVDTRPLLRTVRARLVDLVDDLDGPEWHRPTVCPGWDVADVVAHVVGDDLGRLSRTHDGVALRPRPGEDLPTFLDRINEEWVVAFRRLSPTVLVSLLGAGGAEVLDLWDGLALDAPADGVTWAGTDDGPAWMDLARDTTEYWIHEQQIREAVDRPHDDPGEVITVVGVLSRGLPHALREVGAGDGARVVVRADDLGVGWSVERRDGRWWWAGAAPPAGDVGDAGGVGDAEGVGDIGGVGAAGDVGAVGDAEGVRDIGGVGAADDVGAVGDVGRVGDAGDGPAPVAVVSASGRALWRRWSRHPAGTRDLFAATGDPAAAAAVVDHLAIIRPPDDA